MDGASAVAQYLIRKGHRAISVPNGREALAMLTSARPDAILLDVRMPEMDGVTFLQVLRSYLGWQDIPVVIFTALPDGPELERTKKYNVHAVLLKAEATLEHVTQTLEASLKPRIA
jgi:CheY-like chemotaxis protein